MFLEKNYTPFYNSFLLLCSRKGVSPSVAARDAGISSGAPTAWKRGAVPKPAQRQRLCDYFGVTDDILLGYTSIDEQGTKQTPSFKPSIPGAFVDEYGTVSYGQKENTPTPEGERNEEHRINPAYFRVMQDAQDKGIPPEDLQMALDFIERARRRDQE